MAAGPRGCSWSSPTRTRTRTATEPGRVAWVTATTHQVGQGFNLLYVAGLSRYRNFIATIPASFHHSRYSIFFGRTWTRQTVEVTSGANKIYFTCALIAVDTQPDTHDVDQSEIRTQILLATASSTLRSRSSFTHMLAEVRQPRRDQTPRALTFSRKKTQQQILHCRHLKKLRAFSPPEGTGPVSRLQLLSRRVQSHPLAVSARQLGQFLLSQWIKKKKKSPDSDF